MLMRGSHRRMMRNAKNTPPTSEWSDSQKLVGTQKQVAYLGFGCFQYKKWVKMFKKSNLHLHFVEQNMVANCAFLQSLKKIKM